MRPPVVTDRTLDAQVTTTLSRTTYNRFDALARQTDLTKSALLRRLIEEFIHKMALHEASNCPPR